MYKLFLCLRYLRSRLIAYFAVLGVALCVAMMLIVISVMNGFLDKIEMAAKGLFSDVIVESTDMNGIALYDEFIAEVTQRVPEVQAASPFILTGGFLRMQGYEYRQAVRIAGIRLPGRARVSDFEEGLFAQRGVASPSFDPPIDLLLERVNELLEGTGGLYRSQVRPIGERIPAEQAALLGRFIDAMSFQQEAAAILRRARPHQLEIRRLSREIEALYAQSGEQAAETAEQLTARLEKLTEEADFQPPAYRIILGLGIRGLSFRTEQGQTIRLIVPGHKVVLSIVPLGRQMSLTEIPMNTATFTVVDDCRTDVSSIDSEFVYLPFETLQRLNNMAGEFSADAPSRIVRPPRCSQIHIKVKDDFSRGRKLHETAGKIRRVWAEFHVRNPQASAGKVSVETWRQRQVKVIGPIEKQRTLTVIMFGIISVVSVVLIFAIFYMIVVQKTRDIGVLKAVGASSGGVAWIFLTYGAAVGLLGAVLGTVGGYYFVRYINPIQDAIDKWFGFRVWSKEVFMFEKIPNQVDLTTAGLIVIGAVVAGVVGALIPAVRAARMQPVEALRYE